MSIDVRMVSEETRFIAEEDDIDLSRAVQYIRRTSQSDLKEECLKAEWAATKSAFDRGLLANLVTEDAFWREVKDLAKKELEQEVEVMGDEHFRKMFKEFDADNSGTIDIDELKQLLQVAMGMNCTDAEVKELMGQVDTDGNGAIDEDEFLEIMTAARRQQEESALITSNRENVSPVIRSPNEERPRPTTSGGRGSIEEYKDRLKQKAAQAQYQVPDYRGAVGGSTSAAASSTLSPSTVPLQPTSETPEERSQRMQEIEERRLWEQKRRAMEEEDKGGLPQSAPRTGTTPVFRDPHTGNEGSTPMSESLFPAASSAPPRKPQRPPSSPVGSSASPRSPRSPTWSSPTRSSGGGHVPRFMQSTGSSKLKNR